MTTPARAAPRRIGAALVAVTLLAAALRLFRLGTQPLWIDEDSSFEGARAFARDGFDGLTSDQIAPLHTLILWAFARVGGTGEWVLRLPSAIAGVACVPLTFLVARRLLRDARVALAAAGLVAVAPFAIWYAQEARMYALLMLLALIHVELSWLATGRALRAGELAALALVTTLGLYTHHYMLLLSASFGLFLLLSRGIAGVAVMLRTRRLWTWAATQAAALLLFGVWLWATADKLGNDAGFAKPAALLWAPYALFSFVTGPTYGPATAELRGDVGAALVHHAGAIAVAAVAAGVVSIAAARAAFAPGRRAAGAWLFTWLFAPIAFSILATQLTHIQFNVRYVIFSFPALMILFALALVDALAALRRRWPVVLAGAVVLGVMAASLANWFAGTLYAKEDLRAAAAVIRPARAGALIVADNQRAIPILDYYGLHLPADTLAVDNIDGGRTPKVVLRTLDRTVAAGPVARVWFVSYRIWESDPDRRVQHWLDTHCRLLRDVPLTGARVRGYAWCTPRSGDTSVSAPPPTAPGR